MQRNWPWEAEGLPGRVKGQVIVKPLFLVRGGFFFFFLPLVTGPQYCRPGWFEMYSDCPLSAFGRLIPLFSSCKYGSHEFES